MSVVVLHIFSAVNENSKWFTPNGRQRKSLVQFMTIYDVNPPNLENLMATSMQNTAPTYVVSNIAWGGCHNLSGIPVAVDIVQSPKQT